MITSTQPPRAMDELNRIAGILGAYPVLALPSALASVMFVIAIFVGVISTVVSLLAGHAAAGHAGGAVGLVSGLMVAFVLVGVASLALVVAHAMTTAAAPGVLEGRPPDLGLAWRVTFSRLPDLAVALVACFALALIPIALCFVLIGIPLVIALGYFLIFVPAAVILDGHDGIAAIRTSFKLTTTRVNDSLIAWLAAFVAGIAGGIVNTMLVHIPIVNLISGLIIGGFTSAFAALVSASFYTRLRAGGTFVPPPAGPAPSGPATSGPPMRT